MTGKYLINTDDWFIAPDGKQYKAVWGDVEILDDTVLGVKTNRGSTNWYAKVSGKAQHVIVAGCQIHYATSCDNKPETGRIEDWSFSDGKLSEYTAPSKIFIPK